MEQICFTSFEFTELFDSIDSFYTPLSFVSGVVCTAIGYFVGYLHFGGLPND